MVKKISYLLRAIGDKADSIIYGCGPGALNTGKLDIFYEACVLHDDAYNDANMSKYEADKSFLYNMLTLSQSNPILVVRAYFFYFLVAVGGRIFKK